MHRTGSLVVPSALAAVFASVLAPAAFADEYTVTPIAGGGYVEPPDLLSATVKDGRVEIIPRQRDDLTVSVTLPFSFPFFGRVYDKIAVSDDGWLSFGAGTVTVSENPELRKTNAPNAVVAPLWDALRTGDKGSVARFTTGEAPNRTFVVAWISMDTTDPSTSDKLSFEVLLHETTGVVEIAYATEGRWNGLSYTAGIENELGTRGFGGPNLSNVNAGQPAVGQRFTPNAVPVSGSITRDRPSATEAGLSGADAEFDLPVAGADVAIVREDSGETIATGVTDAAGAFTVNVLGVDGAPTLAVDLLASGPGERVTDGSGATYRRRIAIGLVPSGAVTVPLVHLDDAVEESFRRALNIQQAAQRGYQFTQDAAASVPVTIPVTPVTKKFPQLEIRWGLDATTPSGYLPATATAAARATICDKPLTGSPASNPDAYDDFVVLREYGQHVLSSVAASPGTLTAHTWTPVSLQTSTQTQPLAFLDGFSWWFASAVLGSPRFIDTTAENAATVYALEPPAPTLNATGPNVAGSVAASLWELVDPAIVQNEPSNADDTFAGALPADGYAVLLALDQRKGAETLPAGSAAQTIRSFFDSWTTRRTADESRATSRAFVALRTLPDDTTDPKAFEPNDVAGEGKPLGTTKVEGLLLNPFNDDFYSFTVGTEFVTVAVSFSDVAQVRVELLDPTGTVVATSSSTTETPSPVVVTTPAPDDAPLAAGTWIARVTWKSGPTVNYAIAQSLTPRLTTDPIPPTTAGQPYNLDLTVTGGIAPIFLQLDPPVPGLSVATSGGKITLTGRPTSAGVYHVTFYATDASNSGRRSAGERDITINPPLLLPSVFGVAAGKPIDADVGSGGTSAAWTVTAATPAAGFTVTGGATVRLAGSSTTTGSFAVEASATDSVGASFQKSSCDVVVCAPLSGAAGSGVKPGAPFGYWFDAIEGSRFTTTIRFAGTGAKPRFRALIDDAGAAVEVPQSSLDTRGGGVRIAGAAIPRTARYFVMFADSGTFDGRVGASRTNVRPPVRLAGVVDIADASTRGEARFTAIAGSRVTVVLRSGRAPESARPGTITLTLPSGAPLTPLPASRDDQDGRRRTFAGIELPATGEYVLSVGGDGASTGPLTYEISISPPKGTLFQLD